MEIEILQHKIEFWWRDDIERDLDDCSIEHIKKSIDDGYKEGELNRLIDKDDGVGVYGWWSIVK